MLDPGLARALASSPDRMRHSIRSADIYRFRIGSRPDQASPTVTSARDDVVIAELQADCKGGRVVRLVSVTPRFGSGPWPCIYHIHGGGMIAGSATQRLGWLAECSRNLGVVVISVDYRLAPEHRHPVPVEDCYAGFVWTGDHAEQLNVDPARIIVHGVSAGGGLAAAVTLLARDRGGPRPSHQILQSPMLDDRCEAPSTYELDGEGVWDRTSNLTGWAALLGCSSGTADVPPYAAPARATDLADLPDAYVDVGQLEIFRDETIEYAARLARARVAVELHVWPGACHGFDRVAPAAEISRRAATALSEFLAQAIRGHRSATPNATDSSSTIQKCDHIG